jgi:c-di-GMP phosphodiesterase
MSGSALGRVALSYAPFVDRHRALTALRLSVFPLGEGDAPNAAELMAALAEVWPVEAGRLSVNVVSHSLLDDLGSTEWPSHLMVEVPAADAADTANAARLHALHRRGVTLLLKDRPRLPLPRELLGCFAYSVIDVAEEQRDGRPPPGGVTRAIPHIQAGVASFEQLHAAFERGAIAVVGWPLDMPASPAGKRGAQAGMQQIAELLGRVNRGDTPEQLEEVLRNDPALAFRLLRYVNSPYFGLRVEVTSLRHAVMMLGRQQLQRLLVLLMAAATKDPNLRPVAHAAVRRGVLMEALAGEGADQDERTERFICGAFSLLDVMTGEPFARLLDAMPVAQSVRDALVHQRGPYRPTLNLVAVLDSGGTATMIRSAAQALLMSPLEVNRALLRALALAKQID